MKIKSIYIEKYKILNDLKVDFNCSPITVITGINGSGKTTLLDFIYEVFSKNKFPKDSSKSNIELNNSFIDCNSIKDIELNNNIIYYKSENYKSDISNQIIKYIDKQIYENDLKSSQAYYKLSELLNSIFSKMDLKISFNNLDANRTIYFKNAKSEMIKISDLSTGEKKLITKVLPLVISEEKEKIILIDEPETSLHPTWQNQIMDIYSSIAEKYNHQFIIATHSPQIASSVDSNCIKIMKNLNGNISVIDNKTLSYGKKFNEVLLEIFDTNALRTPVVENKLSKLEEMLVNSKYNSNEFESIFKELQSILGEYDSDLSLIKLEILRKNKHENDKKN